jgi:hypothetical protein
MSTIPERLAEASRLFDLADNVRDSAEQHLALLIGAAGQDGMELDEVCAASGVDPEDVLVLIDERLDLATTSYYLGWSRRKLRRELKKTGRARAEALRSVEDHGAALTFLIGEAHRRGASDEEIAYAAGLDPATIPDALELDARMWAAA